MDKDAAERVYAQSALEALKGFPIQAQRISLVALSENVTFRVTDQRDGAAYVLRLHRPGYHDLAELNSERVWVRALSDAGIAVPSPVLATSGDDYVPVFIPTTGETRYAGLTRWIEGRVVAEMLHAHGMRELERYYAQLGTIMAAMHNQASGWSPPASFTRHAFDADGLMGEAPFWGRFWEHPGLTAAEQRTLLGARERIRGALDRYGRDPTTFSMIHADLHLDNLVVNGSQLTVIDFDDAGFGWHMFELATSLYFIRREPYYETARDALLAGYRRHRPLPDEHTRLLPMFLAARGTTYLGWVHTRKGERVATELTPQLIDLAIAAAHDYLDAG
jgi:Ser/Thr protein kinase RdoA (MazF antagonist)